jgi:hypothetical protein
VVDREKRRRGSRKERKWLGSERHYIGVGVRNYISGFEGSQAVLARPPGRGNAYDRN